MATKVENRYGPDVVGNFSIVGFRYNDAPDSHWWHVTSHPNNSGRNVIDLIVSGDVFRHASTSLLDNGAFSIRPTGALTPIDPAEKEAIRDAIVAWEKLDSEQLAQDS